MGIYIVLNIGNTVIDNTKSYSQLNDNKIMINQIDSIIKVVSDEGLGSLREINTVFPEQIEIMNKSRFVQSRVRIFSDLFEYGSRTLKGNINFIGGYDANCYESDINNDGSTDYVMENSFIKVGLQKVNGAIDTKNNIISITNKVQNDTIFPVNSSIFIDDNASTSVGTGYSEIDLGLKPICIAHFYVSSGTTYDIYYKLYSFADFIVVEVKNIS